MEGLNFNQTSLDNLMTGTSEFPSRKNRINLEAYQAYYNSNDPQTNNSSY